MKHQLPIDKTVKRLQKETHQFSYDADRLKKAYDMVLMLEIIYPKYRMGLCKKS